MNTFYLFLFEPLGYSLVCLAFFIFLLICSIRESFILATLSTLGFFWLYHSFFTSFSWGFLVSIIGVYLILGLCFSLWKWREFVKNKVDEANLGNTYLYDYEVKASDNKGKIYNWIAFWPPVLIWDLGGSIVKDMFKMFSGLFDRITESQLKNLKKKS